MSNSIVPIRRLSANTARGAVLQVSIRTDAVVDLKFLDGHRERVRLVDALGQHLLYRDSTGALRASVSSGVSGARMCQPGVAPNARPMTATLSKPKQTAPADKPAMSPTETLGEVASAAFLARGILNVAKISGMPTWQSAYFLGNGINHFTGRKFLPEWLQKGPVKDLLEFAVIGDMLVSSLPGVRDAAAHLRGTMAQLQAARGAAHVSPMTHLVDAARALVSGMPEEPAAAGVAAAAGAAAAQPTPNIPALAPLFKFMKPLYYIGLTASSVSGMLALPDYLHEHGTGGLMSTTSGRDAWIGALSAAAQLAALYMPSSPLRSYVDIASTSLWLLQAINGHGWLDSILGGDPKETASDETTPSGTTEGTTPDSAATGSRRAAAVTVPVFNSDAVGVSACRARPSRRAQRSRSRR